LSEAKEDFVTILLLVAQTASYSSKREASYEPNKRFDEYREEPRHDSCVRCYYLAEKTAVILGSVSLWHLQVRLPRTKSRLDAAIMDEARPKNRKPLCADNYEAQ
jgi:hypothetical protein